MFNKLILTFVVIANSLFCSAQKYLKPAIYSDQDYFVKEVNKLRGNDGIQSVLIYQTDTTVIEVPSHIKSRGSLTFLIIPRHVCSEVRIYVDTLLMSLCKIDYQPFKYPKIDFLGAIQKEAQLNVASPFANAINSEFYLFIQKDRSFYFELGGPLTYVGLNERDRYRVDFSLKIKRSLKKSLSEYNFKETVKR